MTLLFCLAEFISASMFLDSETSSEGQKAEKQFLTRHKWYPINKGESR